MNIRRLLLDVNEAVAHPEVLEIASAIEAVRNVESVDVETGQAPNRRGETGNFRGAEAAIRRLSRSLS